MLPRAYNKKVNRGLHYTRVTKRLEAYGPTTEVLRRWKGLYKCRYWKTTTASPPPMYIKVEDYVL